MSRGLLVLWALAAAAVAVLVAQSARWREASGEREAAFRAARSAVADSTELVRLRAASETRIFGEPPAEDFIERVGRTLTSVGLDPSLASNIVREGDRAMSGSLTGERRREMRIELRPIAPPDLGRFLTAWGVDHPAWSVRQITLRKVNDRRSGPADYLVSLTLSAEYTQSQPRTDP